MSAVWQTLVQTCDAALRRGAEVFLDDATKSWRRAEVFGAVPVVKPTQALTISFRGIAHCFIGLNQDAVQCILNEAHSQVQRMTSHQVRATRRGMRQHEGRSGIAGRSPRASVHQSFAYSCLRP